ncbi:MAG: hypothetical protein U0798_17435 [Gemmataceae bacterium]
MQKPSGILNAYDSVNHKFGGGGLKRMGALSERLIPILRERFISHGLVEGKSTEDPCAAFPGLHPGIRQVAVYDDGDELTVVIDDLTHGHFSDYDHSGPDADHEQRIVDTVVEFLDDLFADGCGCVGPARGGLGLVPGGCG